ncbi:MICOS complex subunit MIC13 homolog QIL1-like [Anopheles bellator]|uniref:MICOS complex subunit MIC13 homolog QIL1-like n=1 Tax=Anopheles bellator TaxID=139047 RepID=UPI0026471A88|nr:MICOS complex subunit MIC13 homolog QIL1-like [Anopheles bellator]
MLRFAIKTGIAGGTVYYTKKEGIWDENTEKVYERYAAALRPHVQSLKQQIPMDVPALPSSGEMCFVTKHYYNEGVKSTIHFIRKIPCYAGQLAMKGSNAVKKVLDAQPQTPTVEAPQDKK